MWFLAIALKTLHHLQRKAFCFKDPQTAYDVAVEYKEHIDSVKRDRELEQFLEAGLVPNFAVISC